ncbi:hypothetical protein [Micromonospora sp. NPDC085948]|uniref:hypothetical protein n=1 Tax=Micromonospora sp. NPDC085948 TaxID=3155293 RepID=UPI003425D223
MPPCTSPSCGHLAARTGTAGRATDRSAMIRIAALVLYVLGLTIAADAYLVT